MWQVVLCNEESATYCLSVSLFCHFPFSISLQCNAYGNSFSLAKFFVTDFTETTWLRVLKSGVNIRWYKLYCVMKNQPHIAYQSLYFVISHFLSLSNVTHMKLSSKVSRELLYLGCWNLVQTAGMQVVLCIKESATYYLSVPLFIIMLRISHAKYSNIYDFHF